MARRTIEIYIYILYICTSLRQSSLSCGAHSGSPQLFDTPPLNPQNVVVVGQPTAPAPARAPAATVVVPDRTVNYTVLTVVLMVVCFFHCNFPAYICLIPALLFATNVGNACLQETHLHHISYIYWVHDSTEGPTHACV